jgi:hypothetical protein
MRRVGSNTYSRGGDVKTLLGWIFVEPFCAGRVAALAGWRKSLVQV